MPWMKELHYYGSDLERLPSQLSEQQHRALFDAAGATQRSVKPASGPFTPRGRRGRSRRPGPRLE
jgi:hypothetical protein